jgi:superfamily II DNA or RNA helicase
LETRKPLMKRMPTGKFKMQDFQREDLTFLTELENSANWSEMGAMKTTTAEWLAQHKVSHIPNPRVLVITTKSGKGTYLESLWEVLPDWEVFTVSTKGTNLVVGGRPVPYNLNMPNPLFFRPVIAVAHYHCFTNRACIPAPVKEKDENGITRNKMNPDGTFEMNFPSCYHLLQKHWDMVIVDEAHRIKNPDAQWTRNIKKIKTKYRHAMTGTGFINDPSEIWSILNWLYPEVYTSYWKFREKYCLEEDYGGYRKVVGIDPHHEDEFKDLIRRVGVRRTMRECFPDIQKPVETKIPVDLNGIQRKMYEEIQMDLMTLDAMGTPLHSPNVLSMLNRLRQIAVATPEVTGDHYDELLQKRVVTVKLREPSTKLDAVMETIEGMEWDKDSREQVVVFSAFRDPLELLKARLDKKGIPYLHLHAGMNDDDRYKMWHDTWPKKEHRVFLCTLAVGSESINLTSAHRAIFLDQSWSPKDNSQAIGRIYRPGQTEVAQIIYIRAEGTIDDRILSKNAEKRGWFKQLFGGASDEIDEDDNEDEEE